jgi:hypothetical protein
LFISWPGTIQSGQVIPQIAGAIDLLPTLLSMTGVSRVGELPLDGKDLSPLILGKAKAWPERMLFSHHGGLVSVRTPQFRLDPQGGLYDMQADPGQKTDIRDQQPAIAQQLMKAVANWRNDVFGAEALVVADSDSQRNQGKQAKGKNRPEKRVIPDDRPFPVGYRAFPWTPLPARDGVPHGEIRRSSGAPNCSYFVDWKSRDGYLTWDIEVHEAGTYEVMIEYTCPLADAGSTIEVRFGDSQLTGTVAPGWDPPKYTNQDTLPRPAGESQMKPFRPLRLGNIPLKAGRGPLTLRATQIPGNSVMDVLAIHLTLLP